MGIALETIRQCTAQRGAALLGVVNVTPDSFYDGGRYLEPKEAKVKIDALLAEGADLLEIGAESSRPGSLAVPAGEQLRRAMPALEYALKRGAVVSIDTTSPEVAEQTLRAGAHIINDVSCLADPELAKVVAAFSADLILMHSRGSMKNERYSEYPDQGYEDVVFDVRKEWTRAKDLALNAGMRSDHIWFDPGLGFHKNARQSLELLARLDEFVSLSEVVVVGASRKSFLGSLDGSSPDQRLGASIAAALAAQRRGAHVVRVHDIHETRQAFLLAARIERQKAEGAHA